MMMGDSYKLPVEISIDDGTTATGETFEEIEFMIGGVRKTKTSGEITYDADDQVFLIPLTQQDTFSLLGNEKVQIRLKFASGDVIGVELEPEYVAHSMSKEVL